jgi:hypothetical protein
VSVAKTLKEKFNEKPTVVKYTGPYEDFEFETSARRSLVKQLARRLEQHGLKFTTLTYYSKQDGITVTSSGNIKKLGTLKYKLMIEGSTKHCYWEVEFTSGKMTRDHSNIVIDGVAIRVTDFHKLCELKTALLFS